MWFRVLAARYSEEAGRLKVGGRSGSCWWREIAKIRDGVGEAEGAGLQKECRRRWGMDLKLSFGMTRGLVMSPYVHVFLGYLIYPPIN